MIAFGEMGRLISRTKVLSKFREVLLLRRRNWNIATYQWIIEPASKPRNTARINGVIKN